MKLKKRLLSIFAHAVPKETRRNFLLDCIGGLLSGIHTGFFVPFFAVISRHQLDASQYMIGLQNAGPYIGGMAALAFGGLCAVNKELKWYTLTSIAGRLCILFVALCSTDLWYSFFVFAMYAIMACANPQYALVIQRIYPQEYRGRLMGYVKVIFGIASMVSALAAGHLMGDGEGWRVFFILSSVCAVLGSVVFAFVKVPEVPQVKKESVWRFMVEALKLLKVNKANTILILFATLYSWGFNMLDVVLPIFQNDVLHINPQRLSVLTAVQNIIIMLSYPLWGRFVDKLSGTKGWIVSVILTAVLPMSYFWANNWTQVIWGHVIYGFATAGRDLAWFNMVLEMTEKGKEGKYQALHYFFGGIRGMLGIVSGAMLVTLCDKAGSGIGVLFPVIAGLLVLSVVSLFPIVGWTLKKK